MPSRKISQREAQLLRKRVGALLDERSTRENAFSSDFPGGVRIGAINVAGNSAVNRHTLRLASKLCRYLVVKLDLESDPIIYAVK